MKISLNWLSDFITWVEKDPRAIADRITLGSAEVEEVEMQGELLENVVVGEVLSVKKHPDADRLSIAEVKTEKGTKVVVCGGTNVREGMRVAFAHIGATVKWHGGETMTLAPVKIRGVASEGMICAAEELELAGMFPAKPEDGERPIIDLSKVETHHGSTGLTTGGASLRQVLGLNDTVLHINNTAITMRPDLFSHVGFARECVALGIAKWKKKPIYKMPKFPVTKIPFAMKIDAKDLVSRYCSCLIGIKDLGETPDWMKQRLIATGWRPVNLPVDITNYVAMETGMPLHSFDAGDIKGDVHLRLSKKGESITTLDEEKRALPDGALVLSDDSGIFDLLGIMGGLRSSTKDSTKQIYLHAAVIDPVTIRKTIIATGHRTEASTVYEKGVPPITAEQGFIRALELFLELVPGAKVISKLDSWGNNGKPKPITLSVSDIQSTLGTDISEKEITTILKDLEFDVKTKKTKSSSSLSVTAPLHRLRDISGPHDVIEEIARIHGYEKITDVMPSAELRIPHRDQRFHKLRDRLAAYGYNETVPLSFISPQLLKQCGINEADAVAIENPLGEETSLLQTHTFPQLLLHAKHNLAHCEGMLQTFRTGHVFTKGKPERMELSMLRAAANETGLMDDPFLLAKEDLLNALRALGYDLNIRALPKPLSAMHPGRCALTTLNGKEIGSIFEVHPTVRARFDLPHRAAIAMINLDALFAITPEKKTAESLPQFPSVIYDETITRTHDQPIGPVLQKLQKSHQLLEEVTVHDLYAGKPLSEKQYNVTLRFTYRAAERTLTEEEVKKAHGEVMKAVVAK